MAQILVQIILEIKIPENKRNLFISKNKISKNISKKEETVARE
jgi:hypothetical protein